MKQVAPRISVDMTMWKGWIGFNISHSIGLIMFGLIFGYLAVCRWEMLRQSHFLAGLGLVVLVAYVLVARIYWFSSPLIGVSLATLCYVAGLVAILVRK